eukprot:TRINITY_DN50740_c0_g1_i1.p1 TRINITY_DN50740_c0_g1~~TRINITY_DN50740_c0_g1_i1.p1  ORF type:complete len:703 (+),score=164.57 TRINITY_DN50740_c0_g1_i1:133-2241(+)
MRTTPAYEHMLPRRGGRRGALSLGEVLLLIGGLLLFLATLEESTPRIQTRHRFSIGGPNSMGTLVPPVVFDMNEDGVDEVIWVDRDLHLNMLFTHGLPPSSTPISFSYMTESERSIWMKSAELAYEGQMHSKPALPVRIAAGFLGHISEEESNTTSFRARTEKTQTTEATETADTTSAKQTSFVYDGAAGYVVVVLLSDGVVLCYDSELNLIWINQAIRDHASGHDMITGSDLFRDSTIMVSSTQILEKDHGLIIVGVSFRPFLFSINDQMDIMSENTEDFKYFAFDGGTGSVRWTHGLHSFHEEFDAFDDGYDDEEDGGLWNRMPDFHMKHAGEVHWAMYRSSILQQLPHRWESPQDTHMNLAYFTKRSQQSSQHHQQELVGPRAPNVIVVHKSNGIEVLHLYTGRTLCDLPLREMDLIWDVNRDNVIERIFVTETVSESRQIAGEGADNGKQRSSEPLLLEVRDNASPDRLLYRKPIRHGFDRGAHHAYSQAFLAGRSTANSRADLREPSAVTQKTASASVPCPLVGRDPTNPSRIVHYVAVSTMTGDVGVFDGSDGREISHLTMENIVSLYVSPKLFPYKLTPESDTEHLIISGRNGWMIATVEGEVLSEFATAAKGVGRIEMAHLDGDATMDFILYGMDWFDGYTVTMHGTFEGTAAILVVAVIALLHLAAPIWKKAAAAVIRPDQGHVAEGAALPPT